MKIKAKVELIRLECIMVNDHPMIQATFLPCYMVAHPDHGFQRDWASPHFTMNFTEEEAEKLKLHSKFELELYDG